MNLRFRRDARSNTRFWAIVGSLLLASTIFHLALWQQAPLTQPDSQSYLEAARDLKDLRLESLHDRALGYPAFLMLAGAPDHPRLVFVQQLLLHSLSILFLALLATALGVRRKLVFALVLLASIPPSVAPAGYVLSESLSACTLILTVGGLLLWLCRSGRGWLVLAGVAAAYAALVRPTYQLLGVVLACVLIGTSRVLPGARGRLWSGALSLILLPAILLGSYILFNQRSFGFAGLTPLFGFNLTTRTIRYVERLPDEDAAIRDILIAHRDRDLTAPGSDHTGSMSVWPAIADLRVATGLDRPALSQRMLGINLRLIREAPLNYLGEVARSMATYWMPVSPELANFGSRHLQFAWTFISLLVLLLFFLNTLCLSGLMLLLGIAPPGFRGRILRPKEMTLVLAAIISLAVIFYSMAVSAFVEIGNPRYRAPTDALILFTSVLGMELWMRMRRTSNENAMSRSDSAEAEESPAPASHSFEPSAR